MAHGQPDFWGGITPAMPIMGEGQVQWFESEAIEVAAASYEDLINFVVPDGYELHVCSGVVSCDFPRHQRYALVTTPAGTWVSPTGHSDTEETWSSEENAYDNNIATYAYSILRAHDYGDFLILTINPANIDAVKVYIPDGANVANGVDVEAYYNGAWNHVTMGTFAKGAWIEGSITGGAQLISKVRVRLHNSIAQVFAGAIAELMLNTSGETPQEGIYFDTQAIIPFQPQAPYLVVGKATFTVRVYNDDDTAHTMTTCIAGFLQKKA